MLALVAAPQAQAPAPAAETLDAAMIGKIREEGLKRSQVMDHISWLSDVYGPRLTGGPGIMQASEWALKKFSEWGLANGHREPFAFGKGWTLERFSAHLIEPQIEPLIGFPGAWTPGTNGPVTADVILAQIATEADFQKFRGKLKGKIVLTQPKRDVRMLEGPFVLRMSEPELAEAATVPAPAAGTGRGRGPRRRCRPRRGPGRRRQLRAEAAAVLQGRRGRRALQSRRRLGHGGRRQRPHVAAAASGRRHDLSDWQRLARR